MDVELAVAATIYLLAWWGLASVAAWVWRCW